MPLRFSPERLRDACDARGMTAPALAQRGGFSASSVYKWWGARRRPGADEIAALAEALGVPIEGLYVRVRVPVAPEGQH